MLAMSYNLLTFVFSWEDSGDPPRSCLAAASNEMHTSSSFSPSFFSPQSTPPHRNIRTNLCERRPKDFSLLPSVPVLEDVCFNGSPPVCFGSTVEQVPCEPPWKWPFLILRRKKKHKTKQNRMNL